MAPAAASAFGLTVAECLEIAPLDQAKVVSGHSGLGRRLRWVHVVDHEDIEDSLTGQELIMTAGVVLGGNEQLQRNIFTVMEKLQIAGLVIALGTYMERVPEVMLERSEALAIPIIVLPWAINFRDVTHSLLTHLVQSQYVALESAERLNRDLLQIVMRGGGLPALCTRLGRLFGQNIGIADTGAQLLARHEVTNGESVVFRGTGLTAEATAALAAMRHVGGTTQILASPNRRLGFAAALPTLPQSSGWLIVESDRETVSRFDSLAAEAGAMAAALLLSQATGIARLAERKTEDRVVDILHGVGTLADAVAELGLRPSVPFFVIAADVEGANSDNALGLMRNFIRRQNLGGQIARRGSMLLGVLQRSKGPITSDVLEALVTVFKTAKLNPRIAVSPLLDDVADAPAGYARAREALRLARLLQPERQIVWSAEVTALSRFAQTAEHKSGEGQLFPAIARLQQSDRLHKTAFVESLACLIDHDWNVSTSSRQLGIHRHTLLNRIERIESILGLSLNPILRLELRLQMIAWQLAGSPTLAL